MVFMMILYCQAIEVRPKDDQALAELLMGDGQGKSENKAMYNEFYSYGPLGPRLFFIGFKFMSVTGNGCLQFMA